MHREVFYTDKDIEDFRLAVFSDLHYYEKYSKKLLNKIIKQVRDANADYIVIVGDILDSSDCTQLDGLKDFLTTLAKITTTIVIVGNHDAKEGYRHHWSSNTNEELIELLNSIDNLYCLDDSNYINKGICFYGFNMSYEYYDKNEPYELFEEEMKELKPKLSDKNYNITLVHSPINIYRYLKNNIGHELNKTDLILSGHMHNGCLPYWFSNMINKTFHTSRSFASPNKAYFPKYGQGRVYERDGYIYQGIKKFSHATQLFSLLDWMYVKKITVIDIKKHQ